MPEKRIFALAFVALCSIAFLYGCAGKGVSIDGNKASIAEAKCSVTFVSQTEATFETMKTHMSDDQVAYYAEIQDDFEFWIVEFSHRGDHDFSNLVYQPNKGFAPDSEIAYKDSNGTRPTILAGNIGLSRAYMAIKKPFTLKSCEFIHKGYNFIYDFANHTWSYTDKDAPGTSSDQRPMAGPAVPAEAPVAVPAEVPAEEMPN